MKNGHQFVGAGFAAFEAKQFDQTIAAQPTRDFVPEIAFRVKAVAPDVFDLVSVNTQVHSSHGLSTFSFAAVVTNPTDDQLH